MSEQTNPTQPNSALAVSKRTAQFGVLLIATLVVGCLVVLIVS